MPQDDKKKERDRQFREKYGADPDKFTDRERAMLNIAAVALPEHELDLITSEKNPAFQGEYRGAIAPILRTDQIEVTEQRHEPYTMEVMRRRIDNNFKTLVEQPATARDSAYVMAHELGHMLQQRDPATTPSLWKQVKERLFPAYNQEAEDQANLRARILLNEAEYIQGLKQEKR